jgi:hypothetical protein
VAGLIYAAVQLYLMPFSGGTRFSSWRVLIEPLTLAAPLLLLCWKKWTSRPKARRIAFAVAATISVSHHAAGAIANWVPGSETSPWRTLMLVDVLAISGSASRWYGLRLQWS